jgi:DNA-directed RNA polymerase subunit E'/Rpb7
MSSTLSSPVPTSVSAQISAPATAPVTTPATAQTIGPVITQVIGSKGKKHSKKTNPSIFMKSLIERQINIPFTKVGNNIKDVLQQKIARDIEGKCAVEGYIKPKSVDIVSYSTGVIKSTFVSFNVVFNCKICNPVEGMKIMVLAKNITKAGIKASYVDEPSPITVFVARDYHYNSPTFASIQENKPFEIVVIGQRFELNDETISVMGGIIEKQKSDNRPNIKVKN